MTSDQAKPSIALLAAPETSSSVLYGLYDVLLFVGAVYSDMTTGQPDECLLDVKIVARDGRPFRCFGNVLVEPHGSVDDIEKIDVAIVCDMYTPTDTPLHGRYEREIAWLKRMHAGGSILASVCSGSLLLAEAGLLDGIECAGHWGYRDQFREHYPKVKFREDLILRIASEDARIVTAGGVTSWQDLALHMIAVVRRPARNPDCQNLSAVGPSGRAIALRRNDQTPPEERCRDLRVPSLDRAELFLRQPSRDYG